MPYEIRRASEILGQTLSWQVSAHEQTVQAKMRANAEPLKAELVKEAVNASEFVYGLLSKPDLFLRLVNASGAAIFYEGKSQTVGLTPPLEALSLFVSRGRHKGESFASSCLPRIWPEMQVFADTASAELLALLGTLGRSLARLKN